MDSLPSTSTVRHFSRLPDHFADCLQANGREIYLKFAGASKHGSRHCAVRVHFSQDLSRAEPPNRTFQNSALKKPETRNPCCDTSYLLPTTNRAVATQTIIDPLPPISSLARWPGPSRLCSGEVLDCEEKTRTAATRATMRIARTTELIPNIESRISAQTSLMRGK